MLVEHLRAEEVAVAAVGNYAYEIIMHNLHCTTSYNFFDQNQHTRSCHSTCIVCKQNAPLSCWCFFPGQLKEPYKAHIDRVSPYSLWDVLCEVKTFGCISNWLIWCLWRSSCGMRRNAPGRNACTFPIRSLTIAIFIASVLLSLGGASPPIIAAIIMFTNDAFSMNRKMGIQFLRAFKSAS